MPIMCWHTWQLHILNMLLILRCAEELSVKPTGEKSLKNFCILCVLDVLHFIVELDCIISWMVLSFFKSLFVQNLKKKKEMHLIQRFFRTGIFILLVCDIMSGNVGAGIWFEMFCCVFASLVVADPDIERQCSVLHSSYLLSTKSNAYKCTPACCWCTPTGIRFCFIFFLNQAFLAKCYLNLITFHSNITIFLNVTSYTFYYL